jgi:hypothetical protein
LRRGGNTGGTLHRSWQNRHFLIGVDHDLKVHKKIGKSKSCFDSPEHAPFGTISGVPQSVAWRLDAEWTNHPKSASSGEPFRFFSDMIEWLNVRGVQSVKISQNRHSFGDR